MRKEISYAIVSGILFGLVVAFGAWKANTSLKSKKDNAQVTIPDTPAPATPGALLLTLAKPRDLTVTNEAKTLVEGITKAQSWLVVSGEEQDNLIKTNQDGSFDQEIALIPGVNEINFNVFDDNGNTISSRLTLIYSSEFKLAATSTTEAQPSTATDPIRQKVEEKIESLAKYPTALLGTITDLPEGTIQITQFIFNQSQKGEIKQISINEDTIFVKFGKDAKALKRTDLAIGDFIVAMGYTNGNAVLKASRVLVTAPLEPLPLKVYKGSIAQITKTVLSLLLFNSNETVDLFIPKTAKIKTADYEKGMEIITVALETSKDLEVRSLFSL